MENETSKRKSKRKIKKKLKKYKQRVQVTNISPYLVLTERAVREALALEQQDRQRRFNEEQKHYIEEQIIKTQHELKDAKKIIEKEKAVIEQILLEQQGKHFIEDLDYDKIYVVEKRKAKPLNKEQVEQFLRFPKEIKEHKEEIEFQKEKVLAEHAEKELLEKEKEILEKEVKEEKEEKEILKTILNTPIKPKLTGSEKNKNKVLKALPGKNNYGDSNDTKLLKALGSKYPGKTAKDIVVELPEKYFKFIPKSNINDNFETFLHNIDKIKLPESKEGTGSSKDVSLEYKKENDITYDDQIESWLKPFTKRGFLGVFSSDEIDKIPSKVLQKRISFIMNLDPASKPGSHWVAVFMDLRHEHDGSIEDPNKRSDHNQGIYYYDSFGRSPSKDFLHRLNILIDKIKKKFDIDYEIFFEYNKNKQQNITSDQCGYYAINFLLQMYKGKDFDKIVKNKTRKEEKIIRQLENNLNEQNS